jgi:hypothetical protein
MGLQHSETIRPSSTDSWKSKSRQISTGEHRGLLLSVGRRYALTGWPNYDPQRLDQVDLIALSD